MDIKEKILMQLNKIDIAKLTSDMVKIKSYSFMENQEKEMAEYINEFFTREGIQSQIYEIEPGRFNVTAILEGSGDGKSLMFSGHMDTVPAYNMENPFSGKIEDGKVYGRGACDMKGPLACMMAAMSAIKKSGECLPGSLYFTGVADEEEAGKGTRFLIEHGPVADGTVVGEPCEMNICLGHKGLEWIKVSVKGRKVHGGDREHGINAVQMAARFINRVYDMYEPILDTREYPILGKPTINIGKIEGGDQPSTYPGECIISLDRRCVPSETIDQVYSELRHISEQLHREDNRFEAVIEDVFEGEELLPHLPFCTDENDDIVKSAKRVSDEEKVTVFPAWTDAGFITANTDSKCIIMGPGILGLAHSVDECIEIKDLKEAAHIYAMMAVDYCR